jgi:hypothetical protein
MGEKIIRITIGGKEFAASLNHTQTAQAVYEALPLRASGSYWGDEIYFRIPVAVENEAPQPEVEVGDLAYWPDGCCFCIFFGKTPASKGDKPVPASPVTVIGRIDARPEELRGLNLRDIQVTAEK